MFKCLKQIANLAHNMVDKTKLFNELANIKKICREMFLIKILKIISVKQKNIFTVF